MSKYSYVLFVIINLLKRKTIFKKNHENYLQVCYQYIYFILKLKFQFKIKKKEKKENHRHGNYNLHTYMFVQCF